MRAETGSVVLGLLVCAEDVRQAGALLLLRLGAIPVQTRLDDLEGYVPWHVCFEFERHFRLTCKSRQLHRL